MAVTVEWPRNAELPTLQIWWTDNDGTLVADLTTATITLKIGGLGATGALMLTKTTGFAAAVGSGVSPTGTPNLVVTWATGELDIAPDVYTCELQARYTGSLDRIVTFPLRIGARVAA